MMMDLGDFDANMSAAAGNDASLRAELIDSFLHSLRSQTDLLRRARCDGNWRLAAERLRGLGKSFHASGLSELGEEALISAPGDPVIIRKLQHFAESFEQVNHSKS